MTKGNYNFKNSGNRGATNGGTSSDRRDAPIDTTELAGARSVGADSIEVALQENSKNTGLLSKIAQLTRQSRKPARTRSALEVTGSKGRFQRAVRRISTNFALYDRTTRPGAPYGFFNGRPIIGENTPINGGVYIGAAIQEAIVVEERHGMLLKVFHQLRSLISNLEIQQRFNEREILLALCGLVERHIAFSTERFEELVHSEGIEPDNKTSLDLFLTAQVGVARHQVLLAAYLIEKLQKQGVLSGCLSLDGTTHDSEFAQDDRLLYTSQSGTLFILDPLKTAQSRAEAGLVI